jgi:hypothetical protein
MKGFHAFWRRVVRVINESKGDLFLTKHCFLIIIVGISGQVELLTPGETVCENSVDNICEKGRQIMPGDPRDLLLIFIGSCWLLLGNEIARAFGDQCEILAP